ncbi:hypothetical protein ACFVX6_02735 [Streptomyces sp. NPDC058289]|uniref:hypothetical protein n=1 Tax=Streptomyces sp. NPDC058289 TaxID=3346425 RepID=UPI0036E05726
MAEAEHTGVEHSGVEHTGAADAADARGRRIRRSAVFGACAMGGLFAAKISLASFAASFSWELTAVLAVAFGVLGACAGARLGRVDGVREVALEPGEIVLSAFAVRPLMWEGRPTRHHDIERFELRVTTRGLQLWDRSDQLWNHPWGSLRLTADEQGVVLVHHEEQLIEELRVDTPLEGSPAGLILAAERMRARARHR